LFDFAPPGLENAIEDGNGEGRRNAEEFARIASQSSLDRSSADIQIVRSDLCFASLFENAYEPSGEFEGDGRPTRFLAIDFLSCAFQGRQPLSGFGKRVLDDEKRVDVAFRSPFRLRWVGC
jgi:hypothetical protein